MKYLTIILCLLFGLLLINSCRDEPADPSGKLPGLYITVRDSLTKELLSNTRVAFYYLSDTISLKPDYEYFNYPNPFSFTTVIEYIVSREGNVKIILMNQNNQFIKTLVDTIQAPGYYALQFDMLQNDTLPYPDGFYKLYFTIGSEKIISEIFFVAGLESSLPGKFQREPTIIRLTDAIGQVYFEPALFPFIGKKYKRVNEINQDLGNMIIKNEIIVLANKEGYELKQALVGVDITKVVDVELLLKRM